MFQIPAMMLSKWKVKRHQCEYGYNIFLHTQSNVRESLFTSPKMQISITCNDGKLCVISLLHPGPNEIYLGERKVVNL